MHMLPPLKVLVSGGSDKDIRFWDLSPLDKYKPTSQPEASTSTDTVEDTDAVKEAVSMGCDGFAQSGTRQAVLRPLQCLSTPKSQHTRPIECFASVPIASYDKEKDEYTDTGRLCLWSADSMGRICVWEVWRDEQGGLRVDAKQTWLAHETAVYEMQMSQEGETWTGKPLSSSPAKLELNQTAVSADQLATLWTFDTTNPSSPPTATLKLPHPYYVKCILPLEHVLPGSNMHYLVTGSTDEQIRVWDLSLLDTAEGSGSADGKVTKRSLSTAAGALEEYKDGRKPAGLAVELEGHSHEVCKLALWRPAAGERSTEQQTMSGQSSIADTFVISAGLDCTIRKWNLRDVLEKAKAGLHEARPQLTKIETQTAKDIKSGKAEAPLSNAMTAEEEAELAELMGED